VVCTKGLAVRRGWEYTFESTWITVGFHSSLELVGLTKVLSEALAEEQIPCNVIAGHFHDHLLVPVKDGARAVAVLNRLRS
jgi:hypothetical protein